jgi:hypothetical protein
MDVVAQRITAFSDSSRSGIRGKTSTAAQTGLSVSV